MFRGMFKGKYFSGHYCSMKEKEEFIQGTYIITEYAEKFKREIEYVTIPQRMEREICMKLIEGLKIEYHTPEIVEYNWTSLCSFAKITREMEEKVEEKNKLKSN